MASEDLYAISADWLKSIEGCVVHRRCYVICEPFSFGWVVSEVRKKYADSSQRWLMESRDLSILVFVTSNLDDHTANAPHHCKCQVRKTLKEYKVLSHYHYENQLHSDEVFFRLMQDADGKWKALTLFTNMQDLVGHEESSADQHGLYEVGGGQAGLMSAARLRRLGIRALVIEKNARVGDSWRQRYPNLTLHTPTYHNSSIMFLSNARTTFPEYIPKGKLANFLDSYAVDQELCIWLSSSIASTPVYDSSSARWTVEIQHGDQKVFLKPKHLVLATGYGSPRIHTWNGMDEFQGALYHSDFHKDAERFRGKRVVVVGAGNAGADICEDFVAHGATEKSFKSPFPDGTPVEELDFRMNSMPMAFILQLKISVARLGWTDLCSAAGHQEPCLTLAVIKQGQDISHLDKDGITFKDGSKLSADAIVLAYGLTSSFCTGYEPIMKTMRALLGNEITDQLPPE
ncbi:hypothetical protein DFJ58DRAFT_837881, partial [Suillus subalutaceus]|uniref:uncharacterized protein n=1 Tax=Suillus subalutaceus TaxID=48586 RepID=UPI001B85CC3D